MAVQSQARTAESLQAIGLPELPRQEGSGCRERWEHALPSPHVDDYSARLDKTEKTRGIDSA